MAIRVITFDLDDTLWDVRPVLARAERAVYDWLVQRHEALATRFSLEALRALRYQLVESRPELRHRISTARIESIATALAQSGLDDAAARALADQAFEHFLAARHEVELFDGAAAVIEELARHYTLGVLTNGNADIYRTVLGDYFDFAFRAEQFDAAKPDAGLFRAAAAHTGAPATEIVHVGDDSTNDIGGAQQLGWPTIWINPQRKPWPGGPKPTATVAHLDELPAAIRRIETEAMSVRNRQPAD